MKTDKNNKKHIIAADGKVFKRKSTGEICGKEIYLGYVYFMNGKKLRKPHEDTAKDFEEVVDPKTTSGTTESSETVSGETSTETVSGDTK